jgi:hypothetical protein
MRLRPVLLALAALAAPSPAAAAGLPYEDGRTAFAPAREALAAAGVRVAAARPARTDDGAIVLPGSGGSLTRSPLRGVLRHDGALVLRRGTRSLRLGDLRLVLERQRRVGTVSVGDRRTAAFTLGTGDARLLGGGFTAQVTGVELRLSARGAALVRRRLGTSALRAGTSIGTVALEPRAEALPVAQGSTTFTLDPAARDGLRAFGVTAAPVAPATMPGDGVFAFPVDGGRVSPALRGTLDHDGGIRFTRGDQQVVVSDFDVDARERPALLSAATPFGRVTIFTVTIDRIAATGSAFDVGATLRLTKAAADALNQASGTQAFREGQVAGTTDTDLTVEEG